MANQVKLQYLLTYQRSLQEKTSIPCPSNNNMSKAIATSHEKVDIMKKYKLKRDQKVAMFREA